MSVYLDRLQAVPAFAGGTADPGARPEDQAVRLDRDARSAGRNRQALLTGELDPRAADPHIERALATMADMRLFKTDHQRTKLGQAQPARHLAAQHPAFAFSAHFAL